MGRDYDEDRERFKAFLIGSWIAFVVLTGIMAVIVRVVSGSWT